MVKPHLEEGQLALCTVTKIIGTTVFAHLEDYNIEGTISFPEIAPGRIRNIRDYAFPGKRIICKILSIRSGSLELSLRRVKVNERNDFNEVYKKEKSATAMLRTILGEKSSEIISKIKDDESSLIEFIESAKSDSKLLEKYFPKELIPKIAEIIKEKKLKEAILSKKFLLSSKASNGVFLIKNIIKESSKNMNAEIAYIAAGRYLLKTKSLDLKQADQNLRKILASIEQMAKKNNCLFNEEKS